MHVHRQRANAQRRQKGQLAPPSANSDVRRGHANCSCPGAFQSVGCFAAPTICHGEASACAEELAEHCNWCCSSRMECTAIAQCGSHPMIAEADLWKFEALPPSAQNRPLRTVARVVINGGFIQTPDATASKNKTAQGRLCLSYGNTPRIRGAGEARVSGANPSYLRVAFSRARFLRNPPFFPGLQARHQVPNARLLPSRSADH